MSGNHQKTCTDISLMVLTLNIYLKKSSFLIICIKINYYLLLIYLNVFYFYFLPSKFQININ